jgi:phosphate transport system substrate-binding protein
VLRKLPPIAVAGLLVLGLVACGDEDEEGGGGPKLSGEVRIDGSFTLSPLSADIGQLMYEEGHTQVEVSVQGSGTDIGFNKLCAGALDVADASNPIDPQQAAACASRGVRIAELLVALDSVTVITNPENPVPCLDLAQLRAIWRPGSTVEAWDEVPGQSLPFDDGLTAYASNENSGTFDFFTETINGREGAIRGDYEDLGVDQTEIIQAVAGNPGGIGFVGRSTYAQNEGFVRQLEIDGGDGCTEPGIDSVYAGIYEPLTRPLYIYPTEESVRRRVVREYLDTYLANTNYFAEGFGLAGPSKEQLEESRSRLDSLIGRR